MFLTFPAFTQDLPLFTQNFTNTFIYNPSFAGLDYGSITLAHNRGFVNAQGAPVTNFFSLNMPVSETNLGFGVAVISEEVNFFNNLYASGALAYHIPLGSDNSFSFGLSGELANIRADLNSIIVESPDEQDVSNFANNVTQYDVSAGINFRSKYLLIGASANRLLTSFENEEAGINLAQFYNGFVRGLIPVRNNLDLLEPVLEYRNLSGTGSQLSLGLFYTFNEIVTFGAAYRDSNVWSYSAGVAINNRLALGYTFETIDNRLANSINPNHELVLRYDLLKTGYKYKNASNLQRTKMALAFRRKALLSKSQRSRGPVKYNRSKLKRMNPNKRYSRRNSGGLFKNLFKKQNKRKKFKRRKFKQRW